MIWKLTCGAEVLIDKEDYDSIEHSGWYLSDEYHGETERKTQYVIHDEFGRLHRYILGLKKGQSPEVIVDHINRNGLDNQRKNLRITNTSTNKKNQSTTKSNQLNFNGVSLEYNRAKDYFRFRVSYNSEIYKQQTKSFSFGKYSSPTEALKAAILFRIEKMKENGYLLDERSTTIENELIQNSGADIEKILGINLKELIVSKVGPSGSKWT